MRWIPLTNTDMMVIIDDDDYEDISQFNWFAWESGAKTIYAVRGKATDKKGIRTTEYMHNRINKTPKGLETDHINGDGLDNRKENLRTVTKRQNAQNKHNIKKTSIYPGVLWHKHKKRWRAQIRIEGVSKYLGSYKKEIDAFDAYCNALKDIGETLP